MARILTIVVAIAAVVGAAIYVKSSKDDDTPSPTTQAPKNALTLTVVVSPEKEALLKPLVKESTAADTDATPTCVQLQAENWGDSEAAIARGREQPDVWSPASNFWGRLLNLQADKPYGADENPSIVRTPLVIAVWEPMA